MNDLNDTFLELGVVQIDSFHCFCTVFQSGCHNLPNIEIRFQFFSHAVSI